MELLEERIILNLKSRFFDIISVDDGLFQYKTKLVEMLTVIKQLMHAQEVTLFEFNEWKQQFMIEASTVEIPTINSNSIDISYEELVKSKSSKGIFKKPFQFEVFNEYDYLIPIKLNNKINRYLLLKVEDNPSIEIPEPIFESLSIECGLFLQKAQQLVHFVLEEKRYKQLFRVTEKVHSSMNMKSVLGEIINTLQEVYPTFTYYLYLSQDYIGYEGLPIKELNYEDENIALMQSYVTGTIQMEDSLLCGRSILYAPLKGKQGIYGVLQVMAPNMLIFPTNEVEFITLLANTAGGAIENTQLYDQSKRLIADLQLINETSHRLNSNLRLKETMEFVAKQIVSSMDAEEVGFILFSQENTNISIQPGSTSFFFTEDAMPYINYFKKKIIEEDDSVFIGDFKLPADFHSSASYRSVMVVPMTQSDVINGFVLVFHHEPYAFSFETFKLFLSLVHHSTMAFTNTILREELEKMVVTDHLTKLYSRSYLDEKVQKSMQEDAGGTFIMIDIDNFKSINDTFGHHVGDDVIIQVANIIKANIRSSDIGARWGGEELAIYLPRVSVETGLNIAERLVERVRETSSPFVTISCGVSHWTKQDDDNYNSLFKRADRALYKAKETGKNKVVYHSE